MLDIKEIDWAISELEKEESSFKAYQKLASLYTIRDQMTKSEVVSTTYNGYSQASAPEAEVQVLSQYGNSEFLQALSGKDPAAALSILDELMANLQVVNHRVYDNVMQKLDRI